MGARLQNMLNMLNMLLASAFLAGISAEKPECRRKETELGGKNRIRRKWNEGKFGVCGLFAKTCSTKSASIMQGAQNHIVGPNDVQHFC